MCLEIDGKRKSIITEDIEDIINRGMPWEYLRGTTVLVTGPYGMISSYVVFVLIYLNEVKNMNIRVIAIGKSVDKFRKRFGKYSERKYIRFLTDSLLDPIRIDEGIDYIIHSASLASPNYYDICPVDVLNPNVIGTYFLLNLAVEKQVKDFILFSSGDVYGVVNAFDVITENDFGTMDPLDIHSCYSESKRMAETMCNAYRCQYGVPFKSLRIWHTYAPTMDINKDPRVFASFMNDIVSGNDIVIKSDGAGKRSFCYIADAVAGLFTVLAKGENGNAYNICNTDQFVSIKELAVMLAELRKDVQIDVMIKKRPIEEHYTENSAIGQTPPSNEKLKELGWFANYDIKNGFRRVLSFILSEKGAI